jgi:mRNA-degrading endonuclease RelE of RelBE toxin-antitoxin system
MSLLGNWDLQIDPAVYKALKRIPHFGDVQKMKGEVNTWRRRIRAYRIFYKIKVAEKIILVFKLERRTSKSY